MWFNSIWVAGMQDYHLYCLDQEGRTVDAKVIEAFSDAEAVRKAQRLGGLRRCEVWRGQHLIAQVTEFSPDPA